MSSVRMFRSATPFSARRIGLLSTFPPKLCGLATFAAALANELRQCRSSVDIVRINDGDDAPCTDAAVVADLVNGDPASITAAAAALSRCDAAIIQHEYGIYGGVDGDEVLELLRLVDVPTIVVFHTVLSNPTTHQREVLELVGSLADRVIVMSEMARARLRNLYDIDQTKVEMIAHGATPVGPLPSRSHAATNVVRAELLTWGLLGPGKGIEHVVDALGLIGSDGKRPRYTVAGVTHPKVFARDGDRYRDSLVRRASSLGLDDVVSFDDSYRDVGELMQFVATSTAVVLPYDSREQVTSGVLVDAIAAGRPVIATAFPHAIELLGSGAGIVVAQSDPVALAGAIRLLTEDKSLLASMTAEAVRLAPSLSWATVAGQYAQLSDELIGANEAVAM